MSDSADLWRDHKDARQEKRASNRELSAKYLDDNGVVHTTHNGGAHLIVEGNTGYIDFWPGTGRWIVRECGLKGFGVKNLVHGIVHKEI